MSRKKEIDNGTKASFFLSEEMLNEMKAEAARLDTPTSNLLRRAWKLVLPQIKALDTLPADGR